MRLLHTMLRVGDLARSVDFYTNVLGMRVLRNERVAIGQGALAFDLVGVDDHRSGMIGQGGEDLDRALGGREAPGLGARARAGNCASDRHTRWSHPAAACSHRRTDTRRSIAAATGDGPSLSQRQLHRTQP